MPNLDVRIKLRGDGLAESDELSLRHKFQDEIERRGIGTDLGGGSGLGEMDISVEVSDSDTAKSKLRELAEELGVKEGLVIEEVPPERTLSAEHPFFGDEVSSYSREQALQDGFLVDVSDVAKEAGIVFPVALTTAVFDKYVEMPKRLEGLQDERGRLWDVVWMLQYAIRRSGSPSDQMRFKLRVQNDDKGPKEVELKAVCGPGDDLKPVITVMLPDED